MTESAPKRTGERQKVVNVFISSTFRDTQDERDHLVTVVFPRLRDRLFRLGLELNDIDLRWGVPESGVDGEKANTWEYCRRWIDSAKPFFVCILSQRYGTVLKDPKEVGPSGLSLTHKEVRYALGLGHRERSFFYFRQQPRLVGASRRAYQSLHVQRRYAKRLARLFEEIEDSGRPVRSYRPQWRRGRLRDLREFGDQVLEDLWSGVLRDRRFGLADAWNKAQSDLPEQDLVHMIEDEASPIPRPVWEQIVKHARIEATDPWDVERMEMQAFAERRLRWFSGRESIYRVLERATRRGGRVVVVRGESGVGKTTLLARLAGISRARATVVSHFVGATVGSADLRRTLIRLNREVELSTTSRARTGPMTSLQVAQRRLRRTLARAESRKPILLIIDAVNQMTSGHELNWLPETISKDITVVISCVRSESDSGESLNQLLNARIEALDAVSKIIDLKPLTPPEIRTLVRRFLSEYCKELEPRQVTAISEVDAAGNPLYLTTALNELRLMSGENLIRKVASRLENLEVEWSNPVDVFDSVLGRLERFGKRPVRAWCTFLALGRQGLSSTELSDLLKAKFGPEGSETAYRVERSVRAYLQHRGSQLDFYHSQFRTAVQQRYRLPSDEDRDPLKLPSPRIRKVHAEIADQFVRRWKRTDDRGRHAREELMHHVSASGTRQRFLRLLARPGYLALRTGVFSDSELDVSPMVDDLFEGYCRLQGRDRRFARAVSHRVIQFVRNHGNGSRGEQIVDGLHTGLVYRQAARNLYDEVFSLGARGGLLRGPKLREARMLFQVRLANGQRRQRRFTEAARTFRRALDWRMGLSAQSEEDCQEIGLIYYELGYIQFLKGDLGRAVELFSQGVAWAHRGKDAVGAWISDALRCWCRVLEQPASQDAMGRRFEKLAEWFRAEVGDENARRWVSNALAHRFSIAVFQKDREKARRVFDELQRDPWRQRYDRDNRGTFLRLYDARMRLLEGKPDKASELFASYASTIANPTDTEGISWVYLDWGRAEAACDHTRRAREIWGEGMQAPPDNGNRIWQRAIRRELS